MRKATATVIYNRNTMQIYNITVNHKSDFITLLSYDLNVPPSPYCYNTFNALYDAVLKILKNNNFYTAVCKQFDADYYDIAFIDINNPVYIAKMPYHNNI